MKLIYLSQNLKIHKKIYICTRWYGMSKSVFKSQENFQGFMSVALELHNEVGNVIIPLLVKNNPYTAFATSL